MTDLPPMVPCPFCGSRDTAPVATTPQLASEAGAQPTDDDARLAEIERKYRSLQSGMLPRDDALFLLCLLDEARADERKKLVSMLRQLSAGSLLDFDETSVVYRLIEDHRDTFKVLADLLERTP